MEDKERQLEFDDHKVAGFVYGRQNENLRVIEQLLGVQVNARGTRVELKAPDEDSLSLAATALIQLYELVDKGFAVGPVEVRRSVEMLRGGGEGVHLSDVYLDSVFTSARNRSIAPKGLNQKRYVDAMRQHDIVFGIGPAGTGKTYLAMAMALAALTRKQVQRVVLTRPAVEAGEKLGFLPGDLREKVNPYLRPLYDALHDMLEFERAQRLIERNAIEVAPLAFMRGRTLNNSFVILDEAQNTTRAQMKMFLTRLGYDSKAVITGDVTQTDLPSNTRSGLVDARRVLGGVPGIGFCEFTKEDVVRHPLVMRIIQAYDADAERAEAARLAARAFEEDEDREPARQGDDDRR